MTHPGRAAAVGLALVALLSGCARSQESNADARNFSLPSLRQPGRTISLADYAGKAVIISFFASWCPPCQREAALLARFYRAYHRQATMIGIDPSDQRSAALALVRGAGVTFAVAADHTLATANAYGAQGLPATYFLNAQHKVITKVLGPVTMQQLIEGTALMNNPQASPTPSPPPG